MQPVDLLQKFLADNHLSIALSKPEVKFIENGGVIVESPQLIVSALPGASLEPLESTIKSEEPNNDGQVPN